MHEKIRKINQFALPIIIIITGICFIAAALIMYFTGGDTPYTRERVGTYLLYLLIPSVPCIASIVFEAVDGLFRKATEDNSVRGTHTSREMLQSFYSRFNLARADSITVVAVEKERKYRRVWYILAVALSVLSITLAFILLFVRNYTIEHLNTDVIGAIVVALPLSLLALAVWCVTLILCDKSYTRELDGLKAATKDNPSLILRQATKNERKTNCKVIIWITRCVIFALAATFIVLGILNGGMEDVLSKAVKICTECIGLG